MKIFQLIVVLMVWGGTPITLMAEDTDVTMEIIESLDDVSVHHRISLPSRAVVQDALDMAVGKIVINQQKRNIHNELQDIRQGEQRELITGSEAKDSVKANTFLYNDSRSDLNVLKSLTEKGDGIFRGKPVDSEISTTGITRPNENQKSQ